MPSLAQIGQFLNVLRFFQAKSAFNQTAVTSSMMSSNQVYFQINSKVARNLHAKFGMNETFTLFFLRFFQAADTIRNGRRDIIDDVIEPSLLSEQFQGGKKPPCQVWRRSNTF
jgi:hypothetical protein